MGTRAGPLPAHDRTAPYGPAVPTQQEDAGHGTGAGLALAPAAAALYGDLRLSVLLRRLLLQSGELLDAVAGSVSFVEPGPGRYVKVAERGASCRLGESFPLEHGVTGQVVQRRRPVVLARYSDVPVGHVPATHPAHRGAVAAVPIWWRGEVIGANVAFAGRQREFSAHEVDELEVLSQVAAAGIGGIVASGGADPSLAHLIRDRSADLPGEGAEGSEGARGRVPVVVTETGPVRRTSPEVTRTVTELVRVLQREAGSRPTAGPLRVAVVHQAHGLRVLVHDGGGAAAPGSSHPAWQDLVAGSGGGVDVERVPGWGVLVRVDLPYEPTRPEPAEPPPLTPREREVLALLARGWTDRQVADALVLSRKTVEKHVGAVLRKTGTTSRTAAAVLALEHGWVPSGA